MKIISRKVHGIADYLWAVAVLVFPWLFDFTGSLTALLLFLIAGLAVLAMALYTNYELGAVKSIPMAFHLDMDMTTGFILLTSPWVFGFYSDVFWPHIIFGATAFIFGLFSERDSLKQNT
jgi:hypothetical protein